MNTQTILLIGRLTADVELKTTPNGKSVVNFDIAIDNGKQTNGEDSTTYVSCVAYGNRAEFLAKWFSKGDPAIISGKLRNNNYTDKNGVKHYRLVLVTTDVSFVPKPVNRSQTAKSEEGLNDIDVEEFEEIEEISELPY